MPPSPTPPRRRLAELVGLFVLAPSALAFAPGWIVIPAILAGAGLCLSLLLRDRGFDRRRLWNAGALGDGLPRLAVRTFIGCLGLLALVLLLRPQALFSLPRTRPGIWLIVMVAYPVLSAFPQEIIFRTFFLHRYGPLFARPGAALVASGALFGYAHLVLHNLPAVLLSAIGGWLFAFTYLRTRSTFVAALEHAVYGCFLFTAGLGPLFYGGAR